jgi:uncharacterized protein YecT (DUF1311 family)
VKQYLISFVLLIAALVAFPTSDVDAQSQAEMNAQARKGFERVDAELNKIYQSLLAKLADTEAKNKLRESQRAWTAFRDAEAAFAADQFRGGSAAPVLRWTSMTETTEQRIKQLKVDFPDDSDTSNKTLQPTSVAADAGPSSPMGRMGTLTFSLEKSL